MGDEEQIFEISEMLDEKGEVVGRDVRSVAQQMKAIERAVAEVSLKKKEEENSASSSPYLEDEQRDGKLLSMLNILKENLNLPSPDKPSSTTDQV